MALHLHRAERTDLLADGLGALLADPQPDPFAQELVLVAARGVERWLSQRLSLVLGCGPGRADGVCAGTASNETVAAPAGLTTLADDEFQCGPRMPMLPGAWDLGTWDRGD